MVTTVTVPVSELTIHPAIKGMPRLPKDDPRYDRMRASWQESGVLPPLYITEDHQIVDGRHKYWFARDNKMEQVTAVVVPDKDIPLIVLSGLAGQNHTTKSQRAYFAVPFLESAFAAASRRRGEVLSAPNRSALPPCAKVEDLADRLGVDRDTLFKARKLHKLFTDKPDVKDQWEPRILDHEDPLGLGAVLSGIAGKDATEGKARGATRNTALHNFSTAWKNMATACNRGWSKWSPQEKTEARGAVTEAVKALPEDAIKDVAKTAKAALKQLKQVKSVKGEAQ